MPSKVCTVRIIDFTGYAIVIPVEAESRNEAAARALEQLITRNQWSWSSTSKIDVTVCEPKSTYSVQPQQILKWAGQSAIGESIGIIALRHRIRDLFSANSSS